MGGACRAGLLLEAGRGTGRRKQEMWWILTEQELGLLPWGLAFREPWRAKRREDSVCFMKKGQMCKVTSGTVGISVPGSVTSLCDCHHLKFSTSC